MSDCLQFADKPLNKTNLALSFVPSDQLYSKLWENRTCELLEKIQARSEYRRCTYYSAAIIRIA